MNPEVAKCWNKALKSFDDAKVAFKKGDLDSDIKEKLIRAIVYGQVMTRHLETGGEESLISVAVFRDTNYNNISIKQAFAVTLQGLEQYLNLVPKEYNLPLPIGLE